MELEKTKGQLRTLGDWLFQRLADSGGRPAFEKSGWYKAPPTGKICLYLYIIGGRGNSKHPNTIHLTTLWTDEFNALPWVEKGNNWFGSTSADYYARPDDPAAKEHAEQFIRAAFKAVAVQVFAEGKQPKDLPEIVEKIGEVTAGTDRASTAAEWINKRLKDAGKATAQVVREILINVASDAVKRILMGG